jgi:hypothetical protein
VRRRCARAVGLRLAGLVAVCVGGSLLEAFGYPRHDNAGTTVGRLIGSAGFTIGASTVTRY